MLILIIALMIIIIMMMIVMIIIVRDSPPLKESPRAHVRGPPLRPRREEPTTEPM